MKILTFIIDPKLIRHIPDHLERGMERGQDHGRVGVHELDAGTIA